MDTRCTTNKYDTLYARWLENPGTLLDLAGYQPQEHLLDLCGGTGVVSLEAIRRGGVSVFLFDLNPRCPDVRVFSMRGDINNMWRSGWGSPLVRGPYDVIVIRQAAAYLHWSAMQVSLLHSFLRPCGRLVFNTFVKPKWSWQTYGYQGRKYLEASAYFGRRVFHVQASPGLGADISTFRWFTEEVLRGVLEPFFEVQVVPKGKSLRWKCIRRD